MLTKPNCTTSHFRNWSYESMLIRASKWVANFLRFVLFTSCIKNRKNKRYRSYPSRFKELPDEEIGRMIDFSSRLQSHHTITSKFSLSCHHHLLIPPWRFDWFRKERCLLWFTYIYTDAGLLNSFESNLCLFMNFDCTIIV